MPYGRAAERIKNKILTGEIDPESAAFNRLLDEFGLCEPATRGRVRVDLRRRIVEGVG